MAAWQWKRRSLVAPELEEDGGVGSGRHARTEGVRPTGATETLGAEATSLLAPRDTPVCVGESWALRSPSRWCLQEGSSPRRPS